MQRQILRVFTCIEPMYFSVGLLLLAIDMKYALQDYIDGPVFVREPYYVGYDAVIINNLFVPFLFVSIALFLRFLIQRRWLELASPLLFGVQSFVVMIARMFAPTEYYETVCQLCAALPPALLNAVLLSRIICGLRWYRSSGPGNR